jgi:hypothetical protein
MSHRRRIHIGKSERDKRIIKFSVEAKKHSYDEQRDGPTSTTSTTTTTSKDHKVQKVKREVDHEPSNSEKLLVRCLLDNDDIEDVSSDEENHDMEESRIHMALVEGTHSIGFREIPVKHICGVCGLLVNSTEIDAHGRTHYKHFQVIVMDNTDSVRYGNSFLCDNLKDIGIDLDEIISDEIASVSNALPGEKSVLEFETYYLEEHVASNLETEIREKVEKSEHIVFHFHNHHSMDAEEIHLLYSRILKDTMESMADYTESNSVKSLNKLYY